MSTVKKHGSTTGSANDAELEMKAIELVGIAAVCVQMNKWGMLEERISKALKWARDGK